MTATEYQLLEASYRVLGRELERGAMHLGAQPNGRIRKLVDRKLENCDLLRLAEGQLAIESGVAPPPGADTLFECLQPETSCPGSGFLKDWRYLDALSQWLTAATILRQVESQQGEITLENVAVFLGNTPYLRDLPSETIMEVSKDILNLIKEGLPKTDEIRKCMHSALSQLGCHVRKGTYADVVSIPGKRWVMGLQFGPRGDSEQVKFYFRLKQGEARFEIHMLPLNLGIRKGVPREYAWNQLRKNELTRSCTQVAGIIDLVNETVDEAGL